MTAQSEVKVDKSTREKILKFLIIFSTVILPGTLMVGIVLYSFKGSSGGTGKGETFETEEGVIKPNQLLENRNKYDGQEMVLLGRVEQAPVTCEKKDCPSSDSCCGCPPERNLVVNDPEKILTQEAPWRLRLLDSGGNAFCQREEGSCDYQCPGWEVGKVYELQGTFLAEPPPRGTGWRMFFSFYFEVEEKELSGEGGLIQKPAALFNGIKDLISKFRTSGYYVLQ